ncbi:MAG: GAF domain-containing sensor histidine kinase [Actinomycetota bacterium]
MTERGARRLALAGGAFSLAFLVAGVVTHIVTRRVPVQTPFAFRGSDIAMAGVIGAVGVLIASRRSDNPIGWLLLITSVVGAFVYPTVNYVVLSVHDHGGTLPATGFLGWLQNWLWVPMMGMLTIAVAMFPDGRFLSRAWRRFFTLFAPFGLLVFTAVVASTPEELQGLPHGFHNPYAAPKGLVDAAAAPGGILFVAVLAGTVLSVIQRYRLAKGAARERMRLLVLAGIFLVIAFVIGTPFYLTLNNQSGGVVVIVSCALLAAILGIPISMGIAILRHRLYDIDVVINKAVVFAALVAGITLVYVAVVVGIGTAVGSRGKPNVALSVAATAAVALAFQPLRAWARRVANRLVFGKRATPQEILSVLGGRIAESYSLDEVLPRLAQLVTEATAASRAEVWVRVGGDLKPAAAWPHALPSGAAPLLNGEVPAIPGAEQVFPVRHHGELLGVLAAAAPPNEPLTPTDERLLTDLASHAGLVLRNVSLIEDLRASRQRLVSAQDQERRKIERNLHDGAQQHLVALSVNIRLARNLMQTDASQASQLLEQLQNDAGEALQTLRDLAHGIYPPLLADRGLAAALTSQAAKAPVPTSVETDGVARYPMEVEAAIYFCVLEALQNVGKYAQATRAVVRLAEDDGALTFAVTDDGAGFDVARVARGAGLTNMTDRLEALGGAIEVESSPGAGTTVRGSIAAAPTS